MEKSLYLIWVAETLALVASMTPKESSGYSLGLMQTAIYVGSSVGPLVGGLAADFWGYRSSFFLFAGLIGLAGFLILFGVKEKFVPPENQMIERKGEAGPFSQIDFVILLTVLFFLFGGVLLILCGLVFRLMKTLGQPA